MRVGAALGRSSTRGGGGAIAFDVADVVAIERRAVIGGSSWARIRITGRINGTQFAVVLTVVDGVVARFQMLEDSFGVSKAAR